MTIIDHKNVEENRNSYVLFFYFVFLIIEANIDVPVIYGAISIGVVIVAAFWSNKGIVKIPEYHLLNSSIKVFIVYIVFTLVVTFFNMPYEYSNFMFDGIKSFIATVIIIFTVFLCVSVNVNWIKFYLLIRNFGGILSVIGVIETLSKSYIMYHIFGFIRPFSVAYEKNSQFRTCLWFLHPSVAAFFFLVTIILCVYLPFKKQLVNYFVLSMLSICIYGTKTRGVWLSVFVVIIFFFIGKRKISTKIKKDNVFRSLLFLLVFVGLMYLERKRVQLILETIIDYLKLVLYDTSYVSRTVRVENTKNVFNYLLQEPIYAVFGRGLGFGRKFSALNGVTLSYGAVWSAGIDNQYLTTILETGIINCIIFIVLAINSFNKFYKTENVIIKIGALVVIVVCMVSVFYETLSWHVLIFLLCAGLFSQDG